MPSLEAKRLEALYALEILDTPREERFDRITRTAVRLFRMPKSLLAFVDETRAWVKSDVGTAIDWVPRESSFSELAIESDEPLVVPDARKEPRFAEAPAGRGRRLRGRSSARRGASADLDDAMEAVLASAGIELPAGGRDGHRVSALDPELRHEMVTQLMMQRNKVTHIYEPVKAYGSTMQIRFNRQYKRWDRVEALVEKHAREYAVNLLDGVYGPGEGHAPMVYAGDPRQDVPSALRKHLTETLRDRDATIVKGWLKGIAQGGAEDLGLD